MLFNRLLVPKMHLSIRWYIIGQRESRLVILSHHQVASLSSKAWRVNPVALWSKFKFCPKWENCDPGRRWKAVVEIGGKLLEDWQHTGSGGHRPEPEVKEAQSETIAWQKLTCVVLLSVATSFHVIFVTRIVKTVLILVLTHYYYCNYLPGWFGAQFREELFKFLRHNRLSTAHKQQLTKLLDKCLYLCLF